MTDKLTSEERAWLKCSGQCPSDICEKAIKVIDGLELELEERRKIDLDNCKKIDAQAAVIDRCRDVAEGNYTHSDGYTVRRILREALAAAPEHTAPEAVRWEGLESELAAANARVAEVEATLRNADFDTRTQLAMRDDAERLLRARADAAELDAQTWRERASTEADAKLLARSEAAALRAALHRAERSLSERTEQREKAIARADAAESMRKAVEGMALDLQSEAEALRARVAELEALLRETDAEYMAQVNSANARADAAEQKLAQSQNVHAQSVKDRGFADIQRRRAESEAASLRDGLNASISANARLETEAASLRAEVARCERSLSERTEQREKAIDRADAAERELQKRPTAEYSAANTRACREAESEAAALRARVAELEAECGALEHKLKAELESDWKGKALAERLEKNAANDRADAAERAKAEWERLRGEAYSLYRSEAEKRDRAESEAAALRAEVAKLRAGNEFLSRELGRAQADADRERCERVQLEEHESKEVAALRAEVELQRAAGLEHMRSLSTATELLRQVQASSRGRRWVKRIDAFLSTAPATTEREAAERKALRALREVAIEDVRHWGTYEGPDGSPEEALRGLSAAELACRDVNG